MSKKIKNIVNKILEKTDSSVFPINLNKILKIYNVRLELSKFEDSVSGLLYKKGDQHIISVNQKHPLVRQRFTIAHELGHYFLDHYGNLFVDKGHLYRDERSSEGNIKWEKEANKFAAELLMPEDMLSDFIIKEEIEDIEDLGKIAEKMQVSTQALTYRLVNLGLISLY